MHKKILTAPKFDTSNTLLGALLRHGAIEKAIHQRKLELQPRVSKIKRRVAVGQAQWPACLKRAA